MTTTRRLVAIVTTTLLGVNGATSSARPPFDELSSKSDVIVLARLSSCGDTKDVNDQDRKVFVGRLAQFRIVSVLQGVDVGGVGDKVPVKFLRLKSSAELAAGGGGKLNSVFVTGVDIVVLPNLASDEEGAERQTETDEQRLKVKKARDDVYLLFLKRSEDGKYIPTTGIIDSAPSIYLLDEPS